MNVIILDTNILIKYPKLLGINFENSKFLITTDILSEWNRVSRQSTIDIRSELIEQAISSGFIQIVNPSLPEIKVFELQIPPTSLTPADLSILSTALFYRKLGNTVQIATSDKEILLISKNLGLNVLAHDEIQLMLQLFPLSKAPFLSNKIGDFETKERQHFWLQIFVGIASTILGYILNAYFDQIYSSLHIWGMLLLFFVTGITLFIWREWQKLSYGVFEFLVGFATILIVLMSLQFNYKKIITNLELDIKLAGGLYIMVRGQDNIIKGLKGTKIGIYLNERLRLGVS